MSALTAVFDHWTHPSYERRVRVNASEPNTPTFLWGSAGIEKGINFEKPLTLHIRNDISGQPVTLGTTASLGGTITILGTI